MMFYDVLWPSEVIRIIRVYGVLRGPGHHAKLLKANMPPPQSAQIWSDLWILTWRGQKIKQKYSECKTWKTNWHADHPRLLPGGVEPLKK